MRKLHWNPAAPYEDLISLPGDSQQLVLESLPHYRSKIHLKSDVTYISFRKFTIVLTLFSEKFGEGNLITDSRMASPASQNNLRIIYIFPSLESLSRDPWEITLETSSEFFRKPVAGTRSNERMPPETYYRYVEGTFVFEYSQELSITYSTYPRIFVNKQFSESRVQDSRRYIVITKPKNLSWP